MKTYMATVRGDRYPMSYQVQASSWPTAAARAIRLWQQRFKGSKTPELTIKIVKA